MCDSVLEEGFANVIKRLVWLEELVRGLRLIVWLGGWYGCCRFMNPSVDTRSPL